MCFGLCVTKETREEIAVHATLAHLKVRPYLGMRRCGALYGFNAEKRTSLRQMKVMMGVVG